MAQEVVEVVEVAGEDLAGLLVEVEEDINLEVVVALPVVEMAESGVEEELVWKKEETVVLMEVEEVATLDNFAMGALANGVHMVSEEHMEEMALVGILLLVFVELKMVLIR